MDLVVRLEEVKEQRQGEKALVHVAFTYLLHAMMLK